MAQWTQGMGSVLGVLPAAAAAGRAAACRGWRARAGILDCHRRDAESETRGEGVAHRSRGRGPCRAVHTRSFCRWWGGRGSGGLQLGCGAVGCGRVCVGCGRVCVGGFGWAGERWGRKRRELPTCSSSDGLRHSDPPAATDAAAAPRRMRRPGAGSEQAGPQCCGRRQPAAARCLPPPPPARLEGRPARSACAARQPPIRLANMLG